ncbi:MAG: GNAT family N-acetyltransferase, partial [Clostridia bacterium]
MWTHQGTKTLYSKRLTLRRLTVADAQEMFDHWATDLQTTKYLSWDPHPDVEATRELLAQWAPNYEKLTYYHWGIVYEDM